MKRMLLLAVILNFTAIISALNPVQYLVQIERNVIMENNTTRDKSQLLQPLQAKMSILYISENYILAKADETALAGLPPHAYKILESYPPDGRRYLLSMLPNRENKVTPDMGTEMTRMDRTILLKSNLSEMELSKLTDMHFVQLSQHPVKLKDRKLLYNSPTRIDFGDILNQVNADSVIWFMQQLQDFGTRYSGAPNRFAVADWIKNQFLRFGIADAHTELFYALNLDHYNVVATMPGTIAPDKYIIVGGHHDSITLGGNPMILAPGADDNASGTAAALEIARVLKANNYQPECTIKFITFAFEEMGGYGSQFDIQNILQAGDDIKLMINHDMISNCTAAPGNQFLKIIPYDGSEGYTELAYNLIDSQTSLIPAIAYNELNSHSSDSYFYWISGFPVFMYHEAEFSPYYHSINDVVANCNPQYVKEAVKASAATVIAVDQIPSPVDSIQIVDTGTGNSIRVSWSNQGLESDIVVFRVYAQLASQTIPVQYTTTSHTFIVPNLIPDSLYTIGVAAVDIDDNVGLTNCKTFTPHIVPMAPAGLTEAPQMHAVLLSWQPNPELDIAGYRLYRSSSVNGPFTLLNPNLLVSTSYTDNTGPDVIYYYYQLTAVDTYNHESLPSETIRTRAVTLDQGILIVDETRNNTSNTVFAPNDAVSDQFFDTVLHDFTRAQFDTETDGILKLADIGIYSSILWHGNDYGSLSYPCLVREEIRKYIQFGGNILVSTYLPTQAFDNNNVYPFTFSDGDFMYDNFGIQTTDYSNQARFKYALPQNSGFPPLTVDTLKTLAPLLEHIYMIESIGANNSAQNIYYYGSDYANSSSQGCLNDLPVGVYNQSGPGGKTILLSFPLFNMYETEVHSLMNYVFHDLFDEPVSAEDNFITPSANLSIHNVWPNPFNSSVHLEIMQAKQNLPLEISVFNIRGQKVKTIFTGILKGSQQSFDWDGKDKNGNALGNGVYFIKAASGKSTTVKKLVLLK